MDAQAQIAKVLEDIRGKFPGTPAAVVFYTEVGLGQLALIWTGLGLAFLGAFFLRPRWLQYCVIAAALVAYSLTLTWGVIGRAGLLDYLVAAVILSSVVDFFAVAAVRRLFEVAARQTKLRRVLSLTLVGTVAAPLLLIIAAEIARRGHLANFYTGAFQRIFFGPAPDSLLGPMAIVNAPAVVISISFVVVFLAAGIARLAYVVLPRALYSIIKLKVLCNRKATASIGVLLMGVAIPEASGMMEKTAKAIFG
jgi:hypothetical protein